MAKIDIISLTGLTSVDGSIIASGATIKFETIFESGSNVVKFLLKIYRNRELFESGYSDIKTKELPNNFNIEIPDDVYYQITPLQIYETVKDFLNQLMGGVFFEIKIIDG